MILLAEDRKAQGRRFYGTRLVNENDTYIIHFCSQLRNKSFVTQWDNKNQGKKLRIAVNLKANLYLCRMLYQTLLISLFVEGLWIEAIIHVYMIFAILPTPTSVQPIWCFFFIMLVHLVQKHQLAVQSSAIDHKEQSATQSKNKKINYRSKLLNTKQLTVMACVQNCVLAEYLLVYTVTGCIY